MWQKLNLFLIFTITLIISCFLSFLTLIYSNVDLFKIDLVESAKKDKESVDKLSMVLKNNYLLFISICVIQVIIGFYISKNAEELFGVKNIWLKIIVGIIIAVFTEIIPNYLVSKEYSKSLILNSYLLNLSYLLIKIFSPLKIIVKERKKFFTHHEDDLIRFIKNLTSKEILLLEPKEAKLVNLAFNLDDKNISTILVPIEKVIFVKFSMNINEIRELFLNSRLTQYPVIENKSKDIVGILNIKSLVFSLLKKNNSREWQSYINKDIIYMSKQTKLSNALDTLRSSSSHVAIVRSKKKVVGIVSLTDILGELVGKIYEEKI